MRIRECGTHDRHVPFFFTLLSLMIGRKYLLPLIVLERLRGEWTLRRRLGTGEIFQAKHDQKLARHIGQERRGGGRFVSGNVTLTNINPSPSQARRPLSSGGRCLPREESATEGDFRRQNLSYMEQKAGIPSGLHEELET